MDDIKIPAVFPIASGEFVNVPSESWNTLCTTLNSMARVINLQTVKIRSLETEIKNCDKAISKVAEIVEEIYEENV